LTQVTLLIFRARSQSLNEFVLLYLSVHPI